MNSLFEVLGMFACLLPILALVVYMAWATRRRQCPQCHLAIGPDELTCSRCGHSVGQQPWPSQAQPDERASGRK